MLFGEFAPEHVDQFDANGKMAQKLPSFLRFDAEPTLGRAGFPQFSRIVKKDARNHEVTVDFWVDSAKREGAFHHPCRVFQ